MMKRLAAPALLLAILAGPAVPAMPAHAHGAVATATSGAIGGPFVLTDHTGKTVTEKIFLGKPFLVYFGFTSCQDVCPVTLSSVAQALDMGGEGVTDIQVLFITVDPDHDTPDVMKNYVSAIHPRLVGLTGSPGQIQNALKAYRVYAAPAEDHTGGHGSRRMNHSDMVFLMMPDGNFHDVVAGSTSPADMNRTFRNLVAPAS
ncbi:MAG: SCO family protein [Pseudomonadota bacterium]|nr:SCO family protein [Pseudomonadota bacterium]